VVSGAVSAAAEHHMKGRRSTHAKNRYPCYSRTEESCLWLIADVWVHRQDRATAIHVRLPGLYVLQAVLLPGSEHTRLPPGQRR
jgi:hypothetical protein